MLHSETTHFNTGKDTSQYRTSNRVIGGSISSHRLFVELPKGFPSVGRGANSLLRTNFEAFCRKTLPGMVADLPKFSLPNQSTPLTQFV